MKQTHSTSPENDNHEPNPKKEGKAGSILIELVNGQATWVDCKNVGDRKQKMKDLKELFTTPYKSCGINEFYETTGSDGRVTLIPKQSIVRISEHWVD